MTAGEDFVPPPPLVCIPEDQPHLDVAITHLDDTEAEGREELEVSAFWLPSD